MRKLIASIIDDTIAVDVTGDICNELVVADAILAALPSMVKDLEWEVVSGRRKDALGSGRLYQVRKVDDVWVASVAGIDLNSGHTLDSEATEAANIHHRDQIMAAFGIEVKT